MLRSLKRSKHEGESNEERSDSGLLEQTKKLKLTIDPGEIRLLKDIEIFIQSGNTEVILLPRDHPLQLKVEFVNKDNLQIPNIFQISVKKFYPHDAPIVRCLQPGFTCEYIMLDGLMIHPNLTENWSPISSLTEILNTIYTVRKMFILSLLS